jgi:hypothetical protein
LTIAFYKPTLRCQYGLSSGAVLARSLLVCSWAGVNLVRIAGKTASPLDACVPFVR